MAKRSVFLSKKVKCPACHTFIETRFPNPRLYVAAKRESDMRVKSYRWLEEAETQLLPHYYAVWQCPNCMFADLADNMLSPQGPRGLEDAVEAFEKLPMNKRLFLASLRKMVPEDDLNFEGTLAMHLAALYCFSLPPKKKRNHNKIGRVALRIGWLYREKTGGSDPDDVDSGPLAGLKEGAADMESYLRTISDILSEMMEKSGIRAQELGLQSDSEEENSNPYEPVIASLSDKQGEMRTLLTMLQRIILSDAEGKLSADTATDTNELEGLSSTLFSLKDKWPDLPTSEENALKRAIDAFDYSYNHENYYRSIEQSMSVVSLIVDLYTRIGQHHNALKYIAEIYRGGMRNKQELVARMKLGRQNKTMTPHDERLIRRKIRTIETAIKSAGETRRKVIDLILKREKDTIDKVISQMPDAPQDRQIKALLEAGIPEELTNELKVRKIVNEKKKGLFSR